MEDQGTNEDDSQSDPHPEAGIFRGQTTQILGPKDCRDIHNIIMALNTNGGLKKRIEKPKISKIKLQSTSKNDEFFYHISGWIFSGWMNISTDIIEVALNVLLREIRTN